MTIERFVYVFDLDGTLCRTEGRKYLEADPIPARIAVVNQLFDEGHEILIETARGSGTGEDWQARTEAQLSRWGVKCHAVRTGTKLYADIYVDDHAFRDTEFFAHVD